MSLFFKRGEQRAMDWWGAGDSSRYTSVTDDTALGLAPVFAAFRFIVDYLSTLPVEAYRLEGGERTAISLPQLLSRQDDTGGPGLVSWLSQAAFGLATGNAVGWVTDTDGFGYPTNVSWLHWSQWTYDETMKQWYVFGAPTPADRIVHIPWIVPPGKRLGLSPIEEQAAIIGAGLSAQDYANLRRGGGIPPLVLKNTARTLDPEAAAEIKRRASASFAKGEPFVTGSDWDLNVTTIPPNQAQFVETLKMSANQVAAAFGIDPTEVGGEAANSLTYSTEELRQIRRASDMKPYIRRIEKGLSRLMPMKQEIEFNVDSNMRVDIKTRTEVEGAQLADGRLSLNEIRTIEHRPPVDGGDFHNVPAPKADPTTRGEPL